MRIVPGGQAAIRPWLVRGTLAMLAACAPPTPEESGAPAMRQDEVVELASIDPARELFISDVSVVDDTRYTTWAPKKDKDPEGAWSFGRLIDNMLPEQLRNPYGRSQFILLWLKTWERDQTVNGLVIPARPLIRSLIIDPWRTASGCTGRDEQCVLDMAQAPFRLLAIVNRPDLRRVPTTLYSGDAGQGRLLFGALGPQRERLPFTVIFEYRLPVSSKVDILTWAERWHQLGSLPFGPRYNEKLFSVTREFTRRNAAPRQVNGSALLQIRTNEVPLSPVQPPLWEMREFVLSRSTGLLQPATVKQEVNAALNGSATLGAWVEGNATVILAGRHVVPTTWQGQSFLAASAPVPAELAWVVPGATEEVRHALALATCSGCHKSETGTNFLHVRTREAGSPSQLSPFLTQELSPTGPRRADFHTLLNTHDPENVQDGEGNDHPGEDDEDDD
ncbi:hypothetical protein [Hyalangium sp.]|uniref:hypothetical protein n=1 Tax=Hyalangium sp. TaxID=2028555 RepID=UPI002D3983A3|nr:hypothetical protein [Hyalangium sp.]HYI02209.1 hypothetical protein [Hyalangium sp.]